MIKRQFGLLTTSNDVRVSLVCKEQFHEYQLICIRGVRRGSGNHGGPLRFFLWRWRTVSAEMLYDNVMFMKRYM